MILKIIPFFIFDDVSILTTFKKKLLMFPFMSKLGVKIIVINLTFILKILYTYKKRYNICFHKSYASKNIHSKKWIINIFSSNLHLPFILVKKITIKTLAWHNFFLDSFPVEKTETNLTWKFQIFTCCKLSYQFPLKNDANKVRYIFFWIHIFSLYQNSHKYLFFNKNIFFSCFSL